MQDHSQSEQDASDEIDLVELFATLWAGKFLIFLITTLALALGAFYLHNAERKFTVKLTVSQVGQEQSGPNLAGLGGLASLAGVSLPTGGSGDFAKFQALMKSEELAVKLTDDDRIMRSVFKSEWDDAQHAFVQPERGQVGEIVSQVKYALTGDEAADYRAPDAARLSNVISGNVSLSEDNNTGFLSLSMEVVDSEFAAYLLQKLVVETDNMLKEDYIKSGSQALAFYQDKIGRARSQEHREALAKMIASEEQKQMLASRDGPFVAEVIIGPATSLNPTSPKSSLVLALSIVLGLFFGMAVVLVRSAVKNRETARA